MRQTITTPLPTQQHKFTGVGKLVHQSYCWRKSSFVSLSLTQNIGVIWLRQQQSVNVSEAVKTKHTNQIRKSINLQKDLDSWKIINILPYL